MGLHLKAIDCDSGDRRAVNSRFQLLLSKGFPGLCYFGLFLDFLSMLLMEELAHVMKEGVVGLVLRLELCEFTLLLYFLQLPEYTQSLLHL